MTTTEFRERLARAQEALSKIPGEWEIEDIMLLRDREPMRLRIIVDGPRSLAALTAGFGAAGWTLRSREVRRDTDGTSVMTTWQAISANGTELGGEWWEGA